MAVRIIIEKCTGCGACVSVCPFGALELVDGVAVVNEACTLCGMCVETCAFEAIEMPERESASEDDLAAYRGVWVFVQPDGGEVHHVSLELIGEGRRLADELGVGLSCMVFGESVESLVSELSNYDIDRIYTLTNSVLAQYTTAPWVAAAASVIREHKPEIVLIGATSTGRDFAGGLATELGVGLTADCTALAIEPGTRHLLQTRPAFGGNIMATIKSGNHRPQMATVRPKVFAMPLRGEKRVIETVASTNGISADLAVTKILEWIPVTDGVNLADANVIVSGGRGMGDPSNFSMLAELAELLDGAVGASRAVVDSGWIDYSHQVGQTGRTVRPNIYFAFGISGAVQHLAGMKTSDVIIAVNKDPDAPIFDVATYGFVGDALEILPKMIGELKKRAAK